MHGIKTLLPTAILSAVFAGMLVFALTRYLAPITHAPTQNALITTYYTATLATLVAPDILRAKFDAKENSFVLVDLRSSDEYTKEHIVTAQNIPAYKNETTPAYDEKDRIINSFRELTIQNPGRDIIVYDYNAPSMTSDTVGAILATQGIFVKKLTIGWNEWRYFWTLWNHEHDWGKTDSEDYLTRGSDPGLLHDNSTSTSQ